jgi:hypothetical protein
MSYTAQEKAIIKRELIKLRKELGVPIDEVVERISENKTSANSFRGGYVRYEQLVDEAKTRFPFQAQAVEPNEAYPNALKPNDALQGLTAAIAEAIVYGQFKDRRTSFGTLKSIVFHDPMAQGSTIIDKMPLSLQLIGVQALTCFGKYSPDLLVISAPQTIGKGKNSITEWPGYGDTLDLNNPKSKVLGQTQPINQILEDV